MERGRVCREPILGECASPKHRFVPQVADLPARLPHGWLLLRLALLSNATRPVMHVTRPAWPVPGSPGEMTAAQSPAIRSSVLTLSHHNVAVHVLSASRALCPIRKAAAEVIFVQDGAFHSCGFADWREVGRLEQSLDKCLPVSFIETALTQLADTRMIPVIDCSLPALIGWGAG
jgi:hypothetical protein